VSFMARLPDGYGPFEQKGDRHFDCPWYWDCLSKAAKADWMSFSCERCPVFKRHCRKKPPLISHQKGGRQESH